MFWHLQPIHQCTSQGNNRHMCRSLVQIPFFRTSHHSSSSVYRTFGKCCIICGVQFQLYNVQTNGQSSDGLIIRPRISEYFCWLLRIEAVSRVQTLTIHFRYVDYTFAISKHESDVDDFLVTLNHLHIALQFMFEKEHDGKLPFLDILVERTKLGFTTSVYRKPTFFGGTSAGNPSAFENKKLTSFPRCYTEQL